MAGMKICVSLIDKPSGLAGDEMRLLRKYRGERNGRFAQTLEIDPSHLSRINNGQLPHQQADGLARATYLSRKGASDRVIPRVALSANSRTYSGTRLISLMLVM